MHVAIIESKRTKAHIVLGTEGRKMAFSLGILGFRLNVPRPSEEERDDDTYYDKTLRRIDGFVKKWHECRDFVFNNLPDNGNYFDERAVALLDKLQPFDTRSVATRLILPYWGSTYIVK